MLFHYRFKCVKDLPTISSAELISRKPQVLKRANIPGMKRWCLYSIWNTFLKIHKITQLFSVWKITNGNLTVALQALSQSNISLLPKGLLPILPVSYYCSYLSPIPTPPPSHFWPSGITPLLQALPLTEAFQGPSELTDTGETYWAGFGVFLPFYSIKLAHGRRAAESRTEVKGKLLGKKWKNRTWELLVSSMVSLTSLMKHWR